MSTTSTTTINLDSTKHLQHHSFTLVSTSNFYPPFTIIPPASSSQPQHTVDIRNQKKTMNSLDHNRDRDRLSVDTFTSVIERETLYSRASHVASILRSLGPTSDDREQGISALCNYVEGKRSKGKNDEEIRKKISILEGMVPPDLGDIFVKASLRSGLARKTTLSLPAATSTPIPLRPLRPLHRSRLSLASLSSISSSNSNLSVPPPPVPVPPPSAPVPPAEETSIQGFLGISPVDTSSNIPETPASSASISPSSLPSPAFTFSLSPSFSPTSFSSLESDLNSNSDIEAVSASRSQTQSSIDSYASSFSSFSSPPPPLTSTISPFSTSLPYTPYSPPTSFIRPHPQYEGNPSSPTSSLSERFNHSSIISNSSLGRAPTLLSPLAIGGWGRQWEKQLLNRSSNLSISSPNPDPDQEQKQEGQKKLFDGISLDSFAFPNPPDHVPSPSSSTGISSDEMDIKGCLPFTFSILDQNMEGNDDMQDFAAIRLKVAERQRGVDQSWLSISDDNSSCGLPSATLSENEFGNQYHRQEEGNRMRQNEKLAFGFDFGFGFDDQDQRTVTGIESSRWSAIVSNRDEISFDEDENHGELIPQGPTEASLIRDAYLKMIKPPKLIQIPGPGPGPEQGDSHTILMAYAQPQPTTACSA